MWGIHSCSWQFEAQRSDRAAVSAVTGESHSPKSSLRFPHCHTGVRSPGEEHRRGKPCFITWSQGCILPTWPQFWPWSSGQGWMCEVPLLETSSFLPLHTLLFKRKCLYAAKTYGVEKHRPPLWVSVNHSAFFCMGYRLFSHLFTYSTIHIIESHQMFSRIRSRRRVPPLTLTPLINPSQSLRVILSHPHKTWEGSET